MKLKKKDLLEIIDSNGELIGNSAVPTSGSDLESAASNTTDNNAKIGQQPFRYDMLGRFGFTLMPFMEGKENQGQQEQIKDWTELMYEMYMKTLEYYYRNPNKLKSEFRILSKKEEENPSNERTKIEDFWAKVIIDIVESHIKKSVKPIDEAAVVEDKVVDKKGEDEISNKSEDKEVREKKIEKIAGLINKLEKKDIDKLINLLENK